MPSPHKTLPYLLSRLNTGGMTLVRVRCTYCKRSHNYFPGDLIQIFGDVDVDSLMVRMRCEGGGDHGRLDVDTFSPTGADAVGLRIRRLVAIKIRREPVWRDD